jgi:hypothetical protein
MSTNSVETLKQADLFAQPENDTTPTGFTEAQDQDQQELQNLITSAGGDARIVKELAKASASSSANTTPSASSSSSSKAAAEQLDMEGVTITSAFRPSDLLTTASDGSPMFVPPRVPDGISLRNFGIQVVSVWFFLGSLFQWVVWGVTTLSFARICICVRCHLL